MDNDPGFGFLYVFKSLAFKADNITAVLVREVLISRLLHGAVVALRLQLAQSLVLHLGVH